MKLAYSKAEILEAELCEFSSGFKHREKPRIEILSTGVAEIDRITGGFPRGAITEIVGPASSGRTTILYSALASSTVSQEVCALVDTTDSFDATSAANAGADFDQLLWIRCGSIVDHAIKATDLLLQSSGFGLVALDLGDVPSSQSRRIQLSWWFRFKRAIENTPTVFVVISRDPNARSCASLVLGLNREKDIWSCPAKTDETEEVHPTCANLLDSFRLHVERCKPVRVDKREVSFEAISSYTR